MVPRSGSGRLRIREQSRLEGAHRRFLCRFSVIPAADVEGAMHREEAEFVSRGPEYVAGLAAPAGRRLICRPFDRDDDAAIRRSGSTRQAGSGAAGDDRDAVLGGESNGGLHIRRALGPHDREGYPSVRIDASTRAAATAAIRQKRIAWLRCRVIAR